MNIFPAIDLYEGKAVRLFKGDYEKMTIYSENPVEIAEDFERSGAKFLHMVDLEGAKTGETPNLKTVETIVKSTGLFTEVGGGIRSLETIEKYMEIGVDRVILGTAAVTDPEFLKEAIEHFGEKIAVGIDIKDGLAAIRGWTSVSEYDCFELFEKMCGMGVKTIICTDISKDGAMKGTNVTLYEQLSRRFDVNIIASGGVSSIDDIRKLNALGIYGAIIGKAYYTGAVSIKEAVEVTKK